MSKADISYKDAHTVLDFSQADNQDILLKFKGLHLVIQLREGAIQHGKYGGYVDVLMYSPDGKRQKIRIDHGYGLDENQTVIGWQGKE